MAEDIRGGSSLSAAVAKQPKLFGDFYVSLVKSGEVSGRLEQTLNYLADYLERSQSLNSKIKGAMAYPMFIVFALGLVGFIMVTFVLPKLLGILTESGVEDIPLITKVIIKLTNSKSKINWIERPSHDHQARLPSLKKVKKLGWRMKISLKDGLLKTIDRYSLKAYNSYHGRQYS